MCQVPSQFLMQIIIQFKPKIDTINAPSPRWTVTLPTDTSMAYCLPSCYILSFPQL